MDRDYFMDLADRFRSPHIWKWEDNMWKLRHTPTRATARYCGATRGERTTKFE